MTDIKLKERCQFCGGVGRIESHKDWQNGLIDRYSPACENPDCVGAFIDTYYETPEEAAEAWDRRASPWRTDLPPKDGTPIVAEFDFGMVTKVHYDFDGWQMAGAPIMFKQDPIRWMEIPE